MRRRTVVLSALTAAALVATTSAAVAAPTAKAPAAKTFAGSENPNAIGSTGTKRTVSLQLSGTTVSHLTIGAGYADCTALDNDGDAPFRLKTKQLTFPNITLNHGTFTSPGEGLEIDVEFVRNSGSGAFTLSKTPGQYTNAYTVDLDIISNVKRTEFASKIDGDQLPGLKYTFYANTSGVISKLGPDLCTVGGNVTVKPKK